MSRSINVLGSALLACLLFASNGAGQDIAAETRWPLWQAWSLKHGYHACWASPIPMSRCLSSTPACGGAG